MDELEATLDRVLSDPKELERLTGLAQELLGGGGAGGGAAPAAGGGDKSALVSALCPYLREDRRRKLKKALRLTFAARAASAAMEKLGGAEDV